MKELQQKLKNIVKFEHEHCKRLNFSKPINDDGSFTRYYEILTVVKSKWFVHRDEIMDDVFGKNPNRHKRHYNSIFAGLNQAGLLSYDRRAKKWTAGDKLGEYFIHVNFHIEKTRGVAL